MPIKKAKKVIKKPAKIICRNDSDEEIPAGPTDADLVKSLSNTKLFKITNSDENHHGYQYQSGLNILKEKFEYSGSCCSGGFYFTTIEFLDGFINYGCHVRDITLPPDAKCVCDPEGDKYRCDKIIFGTKRHLKDPDTHKYLYECGLDYLSSINILKNIMEDKNDKSILILAEIYKGIGKLEKFLEIFEKYETGDINLYKLMVQNGIGNNSLSLVIENNTNSDGEFINLFNDIPDPPLDKFNERAMELNSRTLIEFMYQKLSESFDKRNLELLEMSKEGPKSFQYYQKQKNIYLKDFYETEMIDEKETWMFLMEHNTFLFSLNFI